MRTIDGKLSTTWCQVSVEGDLLESAVRLSFSIDFVSIFPGQCDPLECVIQGLLDARAAEGIIAVETCSDDQTFAPGG